MIIVLCLTSCGCTSPGTGICRLFAPCGTGAGGAILCPIMVAAIPALGFPGGAGMCSTVRA